jgi:hypothetical protein
VPHTECSATKPVFSPIWMRHQPLSHLAMRPTTPVSACHNSRPSSLGASRMGCSPPITTTVRRALNSVASIQPSVPSCSRTRRQGPRTCSTRIGRSRR